MDRSCWWEQQQQQQPCRLFVQNVSKGHCFLCRYRETVPDAKVVTLAGSLGHYPQVESPRAVLKAYFAFLKQLGYTNF